MSEIELPAPIRAFVDATNAEDDAAFVAAFTEDATLDDWGREFSGHAGIASWNATDNIGVHARFSVVDVQAGDAPGAWTVTLTVTGDGHNGTGPMTFMVRDGRIARLVIEPD